MRGVVRGAVWGTVRCRQRMVWSNRGRKEATYVNREYTVCKPRIRRVKSTSRGWEYEVGVHAQ